MDGDDWSQEVLKNVGPISYEQEFNPAPGIKREGERILWLDSSNARWRRGEPGPTLSLLALLGQIDGNRWQSKIEPIFHEMLEKHAHLQERLDRIRWNGPLLGVHVSLSRQHGITEKLFALNGLSRAHEERYAAMENELANLVGDVSDIDLRTPVRLYCECRPMQLYAESSDSKQLSDSLAQAHAMVFAQHNFKPITRGGDDLQRDRIRHNSQFRIHEVCINDTDYKVGFDWSGIEYVKSILACGVRVVNFPPFKIANRESLREDDILNAFEVVFPATAPHIGVEHVTVSAESAADLTPAMFSSIRVCHSLRSVEFFGMLIRYTDQNCILWQWLAYALFCRGARHQISNLVIGSEIAPLEVAAIREIVEATNPLAILFDRDASAKPGGQVSSRRFHLRDPTANPEGRSLRHYDHTVTVDVIVSGSDNSNLWWEVLLPGYGLAWVHQDDIECRVEYADLPAAHTIVTLENSSCDGDLSPFVDLLEIVGSSLTTASIDSFQQSDGLLQPEVITRLLAACPRLENLRIPMAEASPACLAVATTSASHHLRSFEIDICPGGDPGSLIEFFMMLSDDTHRFTIHLEQLRVSVRLNQPADVVFLDAMRDMLARNRSLVSFTLAITDNAEDEDREFFFAAILSVSGPVRERVSTIDAPVRSKCCLAFFSVLHARRESGSAMGRLDSAVLTTIFDFAVHRFTRTVKLEYEYTGPDEEEDEDF